MGRRYLVHSVHETHVDVPAKTESGHAVLGKIPCVIVELVPEPGSGGRTVTLHEIVTNKEELKAVRATFEQGGIVESLGFKLVSSAADVKTAAEAAKKEGG